MASRIALRAGKASRRRRRRRRVRRRCRSRLPAGRCRPFRSRRPSRRSARAGSRPRRPGPRARRPSTNRRFRPRRSSALPPLPGVGPPPWLDEVHAASQPLAASAHNPGAQSRVCHAPFEGRPGSRGVSIYLCARAQRRVIAASCDFRGAFFALNCTSFCAPAPNAELSSGSCRALGSLSSCSSSVRLSSSVCLLIGDNGWDDGAITLAFARTFARHGRVALTPQSEVVEGFSSVSWFLLNSLVALARPSYRAAIAVSQALSVLSIGACTALLARTCALLRLDRLFSALTVIAFAAWGCSFSEAGNGMEMGLLAAACLADHQRAAVAAAAAASAGRRRRPGRHDALRGDPLRRAARASASRPSRAARLLGDRPRRASARRAAVGVAAGRVLGRPAQHLLGEAVATLRGVRLGDRLTGALELPAFFVVPLVALAIAGDPASSRGRSAGPPARARDRRGSDRGRRRDGGPARKALGLLGTDALLRVSAGVAAAVAALLALGRRRQKQAPVGRRGRSFVRRSRCRWRRFRRARWRAAFEGGAFGVTPHTYAESGRVFRRFAAAAGAATRGILTPTSAASRSVVTNSGSSTWRCSPTAKLAHGARGARAGPGNRDAPDLVEAHWRWASGAALRLARSSGCVTRRRSRVERSSGSDATSPRQSRATAAGAGCR